ncbi:hypothetical protein VFPFJ_09493 [Purpureocillium lilacinum]|uniref:Uncharacterized protein n=1 Tax=Purpureocillium lilacinum TaxID=33203 RepID=A0A179GE53_PURLI|nr:hypothetical protein VFPFJ_09493 [Purpureocillium lilacinum]OAQ75409.1 hypothetical protein VFPBJ_09382 [Purpureocillium lilacinum]OAQ81038.1 hypothetical protein VFPFJ_09493 [Purpureocillium lilacinum]
MPFSATHHPLRCLSWQVGLDSDEAAAASLTTPQLQRQTQHVQVIVYHRAGLDVRGRSRSPSHEAASHGGLMVRRAVPKSWMK